MDFLKQSNKKTTTTGRKKIEIKEIDKDANKQVTFSKRRAGLFKKASELCVLCNAQLAVIVFSPADKVFCFGQPNVDAVLCRYLGTSDPAKGEISPSSASAYEDLNREHEEAVKALEREKQKLAETESLGFAKGWNSNRMENWWEEGIEEMELEELEQYVMAMNELRRKVIARADELMMRSAMMMPSSNTVSFYGESSLGAGAGGSGYGGFGHHFGAGAGAGAADLVADHAKFGF